MVLYQFGWDRWMTIDKGPWKFSCQCPITNTLGARAVVPLCFSYGVGDVINVYFGDQWRRLHHKDTDNRRMSQINSQRMRFSAVKSWGARTSSHFFPSPKSFLPETTFLNQKDRKECFCRRHYAIQTFYQAVTGSASDMKNDQKSPECFLGQGFWAAAPVGDEVL